MARSTCRFRIFLLSWLASLASLASLAAASLMRSSGALGDDDLGRMLPWAFAAAFGALAAWAAARVFAAPFVAAARAAERLEGGDAQARLPEPRSGELAVIARAFNAQADSVVERFAEADRSAAERAESLSGAMDELHARDEARSREARMAARMQRRIVPTVEDLPSRAEVAFGAAYLPAENTGGDLYDAVRAGKNGLALLAADVSGRGVTAALIAAIVKNSFRAKVGWDADAAAVMKAVNDELLSILGDTGHFVTAFLVLFDLETGLLRFANAGHPPAFLLRRRKGVVEELDATGSPLGVQADATFLAGERRLEEGDRILLFTDGLTGARDYRGEAFGRERLSAAFLGAASRPAFEAAGAVAAALESFQIGAPRSDDVVALVCEFRAFAKPEDATRRRAPELEDWRVLARRGAELASKGKIEEAVGVYERLLELSPSDATALNNLGTLYWRLGRRDEASVRFKNAALLDPSDPRILRNLALADRVSAARGLALQQSAPSSPPPKPAVASIPAVAKAVTAADAAAVEDAEEVEELEPVEDTEEVDDAGKVEDAEPV